MEYTDRIRLKYCEKIKDDTVILTDKSGKEYCLSGETCRESCDFLRNNPKITG